MPAHFIPSKTEQTSVMEISLERAWLKYANKHTVWEEGIFENMAYDLPDPEGPRGETKTFSRRKASGVSVVIGVKERSS